MRQPVGSFTLFKRRPEMATLVYEQVTERGNNRNLALNQSATGFYS